MPEYEQGALRGSSIALLPLASELVPSSPDATAELDAQAAYFTREGQRLFYRLFVLSLQEAAAAQVFDLGPGVPPDDAAFQMRALSLPPDDSLHIPLPDGPVQFADRSADFLLVIDRLTFTPRTETTQAGMMGSTKVKNDFFLSATCQYALYDNRTGRVAAYGRFEHETRTLDPTSRTPYQALFEALAVHIVARSPIALTQRFRPATTP